MRLTAGEHLGHYEIHALLGAGGMGEVYRATDTRLGREVALKVLPADMAADPDRLTRFHREARAAAALNHPNIVTLYSAEDIDGIHFFTMELVDGRPLDELIPAEGFPAGQVVELAIALAEAIDQCLAKTAGARLQSARLLASGLRNISGQAAVAHGGKADTRDNGFWVAVTPFQCRAVDTGLQTLAEGLTAEINAGLTRFSYLRVIAAGSSGKAARYVIDGGVRQAGSRLRVTAQLTDTITEAQLWVDTYERTFDPDKIFDIQDDLVVRIVSTCADPFGVIPRSIGEIVRGTDPASWSPYEALLHFFAYHQRLTAADHLAARRGLERAIEISPRNADCWAVLSLVYAHEYAHGFNTGPHPLERAQAAASRAVDLAPGNPLAHQAMSTVLLLRKEVTASLHEADRAIALNPFDAGCNANMGANIAFAGDWVRGCALIERSMDLNPQHPVWYRGMLSYREYWSRNYRAAVDEAVRTNAPYLFWLQIVLAAAHGQLGEHEPASAALRALSMQIPSFSANPRAILNTWLQADMVEHLIQGLRKAGMSIAESLRSGGG